MKCDHQMLPNLSHLVVIQSTQVHEPGRMNVKFSQFVIYALSMNWHYFGKRLSYIRLFAYYCDTTNAMQPVAAKNGILTNLTLQIALSEEAAYRVKMKKIPIKLNKHIFFMFSCRNKNQPSASLTRAPRVSYKPVGNNYCEIG